MDAIAKTLNEMTVQERSDLIQFVAGALLASSEAAEEEGDLQYARNTKFVAYTLMSCSTELPGGEMEAAKTLLEQGMSLMHAFSIRGGQSETKQ